MTFRCIDAYGLPFIRTYKQALKHYESIKPIRGSYDLRPIGPRKKQHMQIVKLSDGDIACQLYSTNVIVYHQDDTFTVNFGGWNTQSTAAFINRISPCASATSNGYVHTGGGWYKVPKDGLKILQNGTPVNPVQEYRTLLDKKKAVETRKKLKPFLNWVTAYVTLKDEMFEHPCSRRLPEDFIVPILERNCFDSYEPLAKMLFHRYNIFEDGQESLFRQAYRLTDAFIKVPVPLGTIKSGTDWGMV